jgi:hypothetical protein
MRTGRKAAAVAAAVVLAMLGAGAASASTPEQATGRTVAAAGSSAAYPAAVARPWGFTCNATFNWVHQNWPNISVRTAANQLVYTRSFLYRWNGRAWVKVRTSSWYVGVSNVTGRKVLGYTFGGLPYYFAIAGHPSLVAANDGYGYLRLSNGYYKTLEQYRAAGRAWQAWSYVQGFPAKKYCVV